MRYCIVTFRSVMPAQHAEHLLKSRGINCQVHRTPRRLQNRGCGYSLQVSMKEIHKCIQLLQENDIAYSKVYAISEGNDAEELFL